MLNILLRALIIQQNAAENRKSGVAILELIKDYLKIFGTYTEMEGLIIFTW
jgi:hypothetical protein